MNIPDRPPVIAMLNDDDYREGDDEEFWEHVQDHLRLYHGYEILFFTDDEEFLAFVLGPGVNADAAVIDFLLKFAGGRELLGISVLDGIRNSQTLPLAFPVIVMTNEFTYENEILCYRHRASAVIPKFEVRPGRKEKTYQAAGFANALHAKLTLLGVGGGPGVTGRYHHFNGGWMFDSETKKLMDPSNVVVPLTWRGTVILEKFLASPGRVLTPEALGVDTGHSRNKILAATIGHCREMISTHAEDNPDAAAALEEFAGEIRAARDEAIHWLARLVTAGPVFDAIMPAAQAGADNSGEVSVVDLKNCLVRCGEVATDAAAGREIITGFAAAYRRCGAAGRFIETLDPEAVESARALLGEFYDSARSMAGRLGPEQRNRMIEGLYGGFFRQVFPDLPTLETGRESAFTLKNLRQRVIPDLRRSLGDTDRDRPLISNVHNQGYCFEPTVESSDSDHSRSWWAWLR